MAKNISETIKIPASFLIDGLNDLDKETRVRMLVLAGGKFEGDAEAEKQAVADLMPEKVKMQLESLGVSLPTEQIEMTMTLGDFLFNLYSSNVIPVKAPLAIKRHEKKLLDLSEKCTADEIELPEDVKAVLAPVLEDAEKWKASAFNASVTVKGETKYLSLSSVGAACFGKVMEGAVEIFL